MQLSSDMSLKTLVFLITLALNQHALGSPQASSSASGSRAIMAAAAAAADTGTSPTAHPATRLIKSIGFRACKDSPHLISTSASSSTNKNNLDLTSLFIAYDGDTNTITLNAQGRALEPFEATFAHILVTGYDRVFYDHTLELSKIVPILTGFTGQFSLQETFSAPAVLPGQLPSSLFVLPGVEALATIELLHSDGSALLCTSLPLVNAVSAHSAAITFASVSIAAATIALTGVTTLVGTLSSSLLPGLPPSTMPPLLQSIAAAATASAATGVTSTVPGSSSSMLSPNVWDVMSFCQFVAMTGSLDLEYPELLKQWTQNFGWSMGLVKVQRWNDMLRWLRSKTGRKEEPVPGMNWEMREQLEHQSNFGQQPRSSSPDGSQAPPPPLPPPLPPGLPDFGIEHRQPLSYHNVSLPELNGSNLDTRDHAASFERILLSSFSPRPWMSPYTIDFLKHLQASSNATVASVMLARRLARRQEGAFGGDARVRTAQHHQPGEALLPSSVDPNDLHTWPELLFVDPPSSDGNSPTMPLLDEPSQQQQQQQAQTGTMKPSGLHSFGDRLQIPAKNMFMTSLLLLLTVIVIMSLTALCLRASLEVYAYYYPGKLTKFRRRFVTYYIASLLRVILLGFFAMSTLAFYQLTLDDAWPMTLLAVLTLLVLVSLIVMTTVRLRRAGSSSLVFDGRLKSKYGPLFDQYMLSAYLFFAPVLIYQFVKASVVGLGQGDPEEHLRRHGAIHRVDDAQQGSASAYVQTIFMLLLETAFAGLVIWRRPFADRVSNQLNAALGVFRVFNVVLLAVLLEGALVSSVSRAAVGVAITVLQGLVLAMLAVLVFYQLGKALWRLSGLLKMMSNNNKQKDRNHSNESGAMDGQGPKALVMEGDEEVLVISVKDDDDDEKGPFGRNAMDLGRSNDSNMSSTSISTLVGQMGIGLGPSSLECATPTEDRSHFGTERDALPRPNPRIFISSSESPGQSILSRTDSTSSHILDYYNPVYLPISIRDSLLTVNPMLKPALDIVQEKTGEEEEQDPRALVVPRHDETPWVQSAYMTRRKSESNVPVPLVQLEESLDSKECGAAETSSKDIVAQAEKNKAESGPPRWRRPHSLCGSLVVRPQLSDNSNGNNSGLPAPIQFNFINSIPITLQGPPPSPPREVTSRAVPIAAALTSVATGPGSSPPTPMKNQLIMSSKDTTETCCENDAMAGNEQEVREEQEKQEEEEDEEATLAPLTAADIEDDLESPHPAPPLRVRIPTLMTYRFPDDSMARFIFPTPPLTKLASIHPLYPLRRPDDLDSSQVFEDNPLSLLANARIPPLTFSPSMLQQLNGPMDHEQGWVSAGHPFSAALTTKPSHRHRPELRIDTKALPAVQKKRMSSSWSKAGGAPAPPPQIPLPAVPDNMFGDRPPVGRGGSSGSDFTAMSAEATTAAATLLVSSRPPTSTMGSPLSTSPAVATDTSPPSFKSTDPVPRWHQSKGFIAPASWAPASAPVPRLPRPSIVSQTQTQQGLPQYQERQQSSAVSGSDPASSQRVLVGTIPFSPTKHSPS